MPDLTFYIAAIIDNYLLSLIVFFIKCLFILLSADLCAYLRQCVFVFP